MAIPGVVIGLQTKQPFTNVEKKSQRPTYIETLSPTPLEAVD